MKFGYGALEQGFTGSAPIATLAAATYDGNGGFTGTVTISENGGPARLPFTGTYSVASDCTYSETVNVQTPTG